MPKLFLEIIPPQKKLLRKTKQGDSFKKTYIPANANNGEENKPFDSKNDTQIKKGIITFIVFLYLKAK